MNAGPLWSLVFVLSLSMVSRAALAWGLPVTPDAEEKADNRLQWEFRGSVGGAGGVDAGADLSKYQFRPLTPRKKLPPEPAGACAVERPGAIAHTPSTGSPYGERRTRYPYGYGYGGYPMQSPFGIDPFWGGAMAPLAPP